MRALTGVTLLLVGCILSSAVRADDEAEQRRAALAAAKDKLVNQPVHLRYAFKAGETVRSKVVHRVSIDTKIDGVTEVAKTRSEATKVWKIEKVDEKGNITFVHMVEDVDMWQSVSDRQEIRFNSKSKEEPPELYREVAKSIGVPLATITIAPNGEIVERKDAHTQFNPGIGGLTIPLPSEPVRPGQKWNVPNELRLNLDGRYKRIKTRQVYTLEKVESGIATIRLATEILTPINDARIESQLVQRVKSGVIRFDADAGRILFKQMDVDKNVVGFRGADSLMKYLARYTEELEVRTASRDTETTKK